MTVTLNTKKPPHRLQPAEGVDSNPNTAGGDTVMSTVPNAGDNDQQGLGPAPLPMNQTKPIGALCCQCGCVRTCAGAYRGAFRSTGLGPEHARRMAAYPVRKVTKAAERGRLYWLEQERRPYENLTCALKCASCGEVTRHAVVFGPGGPLDDGPHLKLSVSGDAA